MNKSNADLSLSLHFLYKTILNPHLFLLANPSHNSAMILTVFLHNDKHASAWREWNFCVSEMDEVQNMDLDFCTSLCLWPQYQGRSQSSSPQVLPCGTCRTARGPGSARRGLWKQVLFHPLLRQGDPLFDLLQGDPLSRCGKGCACSVPGLQ